MWLILTLLAAAGFAWGGVFGLAAGRRSNWGQWLSTGISIASGAIGLTAAVAILLGKSAAPLEFRGALPIMTLHMKLDPLAAFFLVPIFFIGTLASIYGIGYWPQSRHPRNGSGLRAWFGLLIAGMAVLTVAASAMSFLLAWEIMAISAFFLIATEDHKPTARQAAWVYLAATHGSTLLLFGLFAFMHQITGTWNFAELHTKGPHAASVAVQSIVFLLALAAFGMKAGMMPLHFWLPDAHASAPSHVSATLSGVMIKMGIFGLLRILLLLPAHPLGWGVLMMISGLVSTFLGVLWAIGQHDLKKLLAYHSVENIGIILIGLGLALIGRASHHPVWVILGLAGCLLHIWNHSLFKSLLFLSGGSAIHAAGTTDIDKMGGFSRAMPLTAVLFLTGACAICGFPPLNGFISELFIYLGLFHTMKAMPILAGGAVVLAMAGALAAACFTKAFGAAFLGARRHVGKAVHEVAATMWVPMLILAAACLLIGLFPAALCGPLQRTADELVPRVRPRPSIQMSVISPTVSGVNSQRKVPWFAYRHLQSALPHLTGLIPFGVMTTAAISLLGVILAAGWIGKRFAKSRSRPTWDCGYVRPSPRMQYTASSLGQLLLRSFEPLSSVRRTTRPMRSLRGWIPARNSFHTRADDPVLSGILIPAWHTIQRMMRVGKFLQQGSGQSYLLYMLGALIGLLACNLPLGFLFKALF